MSLTKTTAQRLLFLILLMISHDIIAQTTVAYTKLNDDEASKKTLLDVTAKRYNKDITTISGNKKKYIQEIYTDRYKSVQKFYTDSLVITEDNTNAYLNKLLADIVSHNPALEPLQVRALFSRAYWPNAQCMGEGTLLFNIGLFNRLQNESQAAFVLCHELAHQYLNHGNKMIEQYVNTVYSDDFQDQLKKIKNATYQKRQMLEETVKDISFTGHRHSRAHEAEADSMALEFLKNTQFNLNGALSCLALLDSVDTDKYNVTPKPDSIFNAAQYPFKQSWMGGDNAFFTSLAMTNKTEAEQFKDSLKTHPDCTLRMQKLAPKAAEYNHPNSSFFVVADSLQFRQLQQTFDFELVDYCYSANNVSRSLYYSLQMLQSYPNNAYLVTNIGRCFNKLYAAQKQHELTTVVDIPSPYQEKKYNSLLQLIQHLRLQEIASINYYFLFAYNQQLAGDAAFTKALAESRKNFN